MTTTLLVSKRTFSVSKNKPIIEWKQKSLDIPRIASPTNFEIRIITAAANGKSLDNEFKELNVDWTLRNDIMSIADKLFAVNDGMTDIVLFIDSLNIGIIIESHANHNHKMIEVDSIETLKKKVLNAD